MKKNKHQSDYQCNKCGAYCEIWEDKEIFVYWCPQCDSEYIIFKENEDE